MKLTDSIRCAFIRAVMADVPTVDYAEMQRKLIQDDAVSQLPPKVRKIYDDKELRPYLNFFNSWSYNIQVVGISREDFRPSGDVKIEYDRLQALRKDQDKKNYELERKLRGVVNSCTTLKQLQERLPEFEKYMPKDEKAAATINLPALANLVTDFVQAGWPKGVAKRLEGDQA